MSFQRKSKRSNHMRLVVVMKWAMDVVRLMTPFVIWWLTSQADVVENLPRVLRV